MKRRLFTIAAALSLLLCVIVIVFWIRSGHRYETLLREAPDTRASLASTGGHLALAIEIRRPRESTPSHAHYEAQSLSIPPPGYMMEPQHWYEHLGFRFHHERYLIAGRQLRRMGASLPYWFLTL